LRAVRSLPGRECVLQWDSKGDIGMNGARAALYALAGIALLAAGATGFVARRPAPVARVQATRHIVRLVSPKPATAKELTVPQAPSPFAREQRMSYSQLIKRWDPLVAEAAKRFDVPQAWIRAVLQTESGGRTMLAENLPMTSTEGAMGLMQLMPETYDEMRVAHRLGPDPYDPHDNILAGAAYLRWLRGKYGYPEMFAAYNDGPGHLDQRMMAGGLLPVETRNYVAAITGRLEGVAPGKGNLKFTRPDGSPVLIDGGAVSFVRGVFPGEYPAGVQAVITIGRTNQAVREPLARVRAAIRAHGGGA
jgi:hypothetical protein